LDGVAFLVSPPNVFDRISKVETHVAGYLDALHAGRVARVVRRAVD
jgi:hypothetical protein